MEYFRVKGDNTIGPAVKIGALTEEELTGGQPVVRLVKTGGSVEETTFPDYLSTPTIRGQYHIVSDGLKKLLNLYLPGREWMPMALIDQDGQAFLYWFLPVKATEGILGESTVYSHDRTVKRLAIKKEKIGNSPVLRAETDIQALMIFRLDVVESILRRDFYGLCFEKAVLEE